MNYKIREAKIDDVEILVDIDNENFSYEKYNSFDIENFINKFNNNDYLYILENKNKIIGYIIFRKTDNFIEIFKIVIIKQYRNQGLGYIFIKYIEDNFLDINRIILEVRKKNIIAINFYKKNGFVNIFYKKNYYQKPIDDCLVFEKELKG